MKNDNKKEMEFKELLGDEEYMTLEKFKEMSIKEQLLYDFTNGYNENYDKEKDTIKKFLVYKGLMAIKWDSYKETKKLVIEKEWNETYAGLIDPDSNSKLLQEIYQELWCKKNPEYKKMGRQPNGNICADTMTSAIVPFCHYVDTKILEKTEKSHLYDCIKNDDILIQHFENLDETTIKKEVFKFIRLNHTLGNFIPVSCGFNMARAGVGAIDDNWFLTMEKIENFLANKDIKHLKELLHDNDITNTIEWLNQYDGNFNIFKTKNYLQDYNVKNKIKNFTWDNHQINESNDEEFFKKMCSVILQRSLRMLIALHGTNQIKLSEVEEVFNEYEIEIPTDLKKELIK